MKHKNKFFWLFLPFLIASCDINIVNTSSSSFLPSSSLSTSEGSTSNLPSSSIGSSVMPSTSSFIDSSFSTSYSRDQWLLKYQDASYTSIYHIVSSLQEGKTYGEEIKTWGVITKIFTYEEKQCFFMQSLHAKEGDAGMLIYDYRNALVNSNSLEVGNVVSVIGRPISYEGTPEMLNCSSITIDFDFIEDGVPVEMLGASFWKEVQSSSSQTAQEALKKGNVLVNLSHISISYTSGNTAKAYFDSTTYAPIYIRPSDETSMIQSLLEAANGKSDLELQGILNVYDNPASGKQFQVQLIKSEDLINFEPDCSSLILDSDVYYSLSNQYYTGNYGSFYYSGFSFDYYRTYGTGDALTDLLSSSFMNAMGGSISNYDPIVGIRKIEVEYLCEALGAKEPRLYFGSSNILFAYHNLTSSMNRTSQSFEFSMPQNINYFRLESGDADMKVYSIRIEYSQVGNVQAKSYLSSGENAYRMNPYTYTGELSNGVSIDMPIEVQVVNGKYEIKKTKKYTYYTYDYIQDNPSLAKEAAYTDPMDVANYYVAFHTYPVNYVQKKSYSSAYSLFNSATRCWSYYSRTDGYAQCVPYNTGSDGKPHYYELDLDVDGTYSSSSRGVGRLVVWTEGFYAQGYDESPVVVLTDDHYVTFQEYYNNGTFGNRFNATLGSRRANVTPYYWGEPTTLEVR